MDKPLTGWTLVFDLDGTLIDTAPDLLAALNVALSEGGYETVAADIGRACIGQGAKAMLRAGLASQGKHVNDAEVDRLLVIFLDYYVAHIADNSQPFTNCLNVLRQLTADGAVLAVCTNKTQALAERVLKALEMDDLFASIVGGDAIPAKKPNGDHIRQTVARAGGDVTRAIMIGDSLTDERAALDLRLPFIFTTFGYGPGPEGSASQIIVVDHYDQVASAIRKFACEPT